MMRGLLVVVVALGLGAAGCATDVDDPIPVAPGPRPAVERPQQSLSTDPPGNVLDNEPRAQADLQGGSSLLPTLNREPIPKFPVPQQREP
jgi:hypothetical protein